MSVYHCSKHDLISYNNFSTSIFLRYLPQTIKQNEAGKQSLELLPMILFTRKPCVVAKSGGSPSMRILPRQVSKCTFLIRTISVFWSDVVRG